MALSAIAGNAAAITFNVGNQLLLAAATGSGMPGEKSDAPVPTGEVAGPEFGKASPTGMFIIVALAAVIFFLGWAFHRRYSRFRRRRAFAEARGIDLFDREAVDKAMEEAGVRDQRRWYFI